MENARESNALKKGNQWKEDNFIDGLWLSAPAIQPLIDQEHIFYLINLN